MCMTDSDTNYVITRHAASVRLPDSEVYRSLVMYPRLIGDFKPIEPFQDALYRRSKSFREKSFLLIINMDSTAI